MVRRLGTIALVAASMVVGGCVTNSASIYIAGAVPVDSASCTYTPTTNETSAGTSADVALAASGRSVTVAFIVQSLIRQRRFAIATDPSTVLVEEAEIELLDTGGATVAPSFTVDTAGAVVPGSADGVAPGTGVVVVPVVPASVLATFAGIAAPTQLVARITLRGRTNGHIDVEGGPYTWLVTLVPSGGYGVICDAATAVACCAPGQDSEFYCTNVANSCAPQQ